MAVAVDLIKVNQLVEEQPPPTTHELLTSVIDNLFGVRLLLEEINKPKLPLIKGLPVQLIQNYQEVTDKLCDYRVDCRGYNALHVNVGAPYSGRFANLLVQGSDGYGGRYLTLPSPLARQGAVSQDRSFDVPVSTNYATINIADITAVDATLAGYTITAWPYISDGPVVPYSQGPFDLLPTTTIDANTSDTIFRAAGNVGFGHYSSLVFVLTITNSLSASGTVNLRIGTSVDGTTGNFDDCFSFLQATSAALTTGVYIGRISQAETGFNDRILSTTLTANTRIDYFADRLRVHYAAASLGGSVIARIQAYGVVG